MPLEVMGLWHVKVAGEDIVRRGPSKGVEVHGEPVAYQ